MSKKIIFDSEVEKENAIAEEKAEHTNPTPYQKKHLADLEEAEVKAE